MYEIPFGFSTDSSIEISMSSSQETSFQLNNPISTVYIPMSHMMWALKGNFDDVDGVDDDMYQDL